MYFWKIIFLYFDQFCIGVSVAVKRESTKSSCIWLRSSTVKRILSTFLRILSTYCKLPFADKQWTLEKNIGYYMVLNLFKIYILGLFQFGLPIWRVQCAKSAWDQLDATFTKYLESYLGVPKHSTLKEKGRGLALRESRFQLRFT